VDALDALTAQPDRAAILLDVDGVLSPIVPRPEDATVPESTRVELRRLHARYALVACVTGRTSDDAKRLVAVPELVYVGEHGLEDAPEAEAWRERLAAFLAEAAWPRTENKGLSAGLHFRDASDEDVARRALDAIAKRAHEDGFVTRFGRKVMEVIPPLDVNKGTAIRRLLAERDLRRALYAGDDTTDLDAFRAVAELEIGVRVAVSSAEGPEALMQAADIVVETPDELASLLRRL
jgi:trehalose 6-phosphate phosphatase